MGSRRGGEEGDQNAALAYPPRSEGTDPKQIDPSSYYTADLSGGSTWNSSEHNNFARLRETSVPLKGIEFDLRGIVVLIIGKLPHSRDLNERFALSHPYAVPFVVGITLE